MYTVGCLVEEATPGDGGSITVCFKGFFPFDEVIRVIRRTNVVGLLEGSFYGGQGWYCVFV